jgi:[NiFe] hydrogenase assembly HybE family chaperone
LTTRVRRHAEDPSRLLEAAFRRIEVERMAGVPILHPGLRVEAVGFALWQGHWLGVVIAPWFMNLVLVPADQCEWKPVADGERVFRRFASGDYAFLGGWEPEVGEYQSCALFSPMDQFADQDSVRAVALQALQILQVKTPVQRAMPVLAEQGVEGGAGEHEDSASRPMGKREFLNRVFMRGSAR